MHDRIFLNHFVKNHFIRTDYLTQKVMTGSNLGSLVKKTNYQFSILHVYSLLHYYQILENSPSYTFIPTYTIIKFCKIFPPTRLFPPTLIFGTQEQSPGTPSGSQQQQQQICLKFTKGAQEPQTAAYASRSKSVVISKSKLLLEWDLLTVSLH